MDIDRLSNSPFRNRRAIQKLNDAISAAGWTFTDTANGTTSADYNQVVLVDPTAGPVTVYMPATAEGGKVAIKNVTGSTNPITIRPAAGDFVEGGASETMNTARQGNVYYASGHDWLRIPRG